MSITLELPADLEEKQNAGDNGDEGSEITLELPADLEEKLAAMPEEERRRFAVAAIQKKLSESEVVLGDDPNDPAALAYSPPEKGPKVLSVEAAARIQEAMSAPPPPVTEAMKENIRNYKQSVLRSSAT